MFIEHVLETNWYVMFIIQGGVTSLTKALAIDEAKYGVRVNS
jgi:hypothetical protein